MRMVAFSTGSPRGPTRWTVRSAPGSMRMSPNSLRLWVSGSESRKLRVSWALEGSSTSKRRCIFAGTPENSNRPSGPVFRVRGEMASPGLLRRGWGFRCTDAPSAGTTAAPGASAAAAPAARRTIRPESVQPPPGGGGSSRGAASFFRGAGSFFRTAILGAGSAGAGRAAGSTAVPDSGVAPAPPPAGSLGGSRKKKSPATSRRLKAKAMESLTLNDIVTYPRVWRSGGDAGGGFSAGPDASTSKTPERGSFSLLFGLHLQGQLEVHRYRNSEEIPGGPQDQVRSGAGVGAGGQRLDGDG